MTRPFQSRNPNQQRPPKAIIMSRRASASDPILNIGFNEFNGYGMKATVGLKR
jgi:hypothetical protein